MWAKRSELLQDQALRLELDARRCVDTADYIARHARRYGIRADLDLRRNHSGRLADRHYILCHHAGAVAPAGGRASTKPLWIMHLVLNEQAPAGVHLTLGLHTYRRFGPGVEAGRACRQYRELLCQALLQLDQRKRATTRNARPARTDNVVPLRPFMDLPPQASA